jgi:hypothetical protein
VAGDCITWCTALFWVVPAKVQGIWRMPQGDLNLTQQFQKVTGTIGSAPNNTPLTDVTLRGDQIRFSARGVQYTGTVNGGVMEGTMSGASTGAWRATRQGT